MSFWMDGCSCAANPHHLSAGSIWCWCPTQTPSPMSYCLGRQGPQYLRSFCNGKEHSFLFVPSLMLNLLNLKADETQLGLEEEKALGWAEATAP